MNVNAVQDTVEQPLLKLDLGCGSNKREGFLGIDQYKMDGVDAEARLGQEPWIFDRDTLGGRALEPIAYDISQPTAHWKLPDNSVEEVHCSHFLEHLTAFERVHFINELYRVLVNGGKAYIITPHWSSNRAYGDFTHKWPPVSEMFYFYLSRDWRAVNAPHCDAKWSDPGYACHFEATWAPGIHGELLKRNQEYQQYAVAWYKEACQDLHATLYARKG